MDTFKVIDTFNCLNPISLVSRLKRKTINKLNKARNCLVASQMSNINTSMTRGVPERPNTFSRPASPFFDQQETPPAAHVPQDHHVREAVQEA